MEIRQEAPPLSYEPKQPSPGVMVLTVLAQMIRNLVDAAAQKRDLNFSRAGIPGTPFKLSRNLLLLPLVQGLLPSIPNALLFF